MLFSDADRLKIRLAIEAAEARTSAEIVVIVSTEEQRYGATALSVAVLAAFVLPLIAVLAGWSPSLLFPEWQVAVPGAEERRGIEAFVAVQALIFLVVLAAAYLTGLGRRLTPEGLRRDRVHRAAMTQFKARGFEATAGRNGVLIYVSEPEHIAEVIADTAVFAKVEPDHWGTTILALIEGIKSGRPADGMVSAIGLAGAVLAAHFPPEPDDVNELDDHLIEI
jgi:putative membrane protein